VLSSASITWQSHTHDTRTFTPPLVMRGRRAFHLGPIKGLLNNSASKLILVSLLLNCKGQPVTPVPDLLLSVVHHVAILLAVELEA
jgi:hypothetical protein